MASLWTNKAKYLMMTAALNLSSASLKTALMKNGYTPNADDNFMSGISSNECDATNYAGGFSGAGRKAISSPTVTEDDTNDKAVYDAADPSTWSALGGAANNTLRHVVVWLPVTNDADSPVLFALDFGSDKTTNGGDFTVQWATGGIATVS